jgi:hypothetical protein
VVCDLSNVIDGADPVAVAVLATVGRHVRGWSGIPVAVACPDPQVLREALRVQPLGGWWQTRCFGAGKNGGVIRPQNRV